MCCNATTLDEILAQTTEEGGVTQSPKAPLSVTEVRSRKTKGRSVCAVMPTTLDEILAQTTEEGGVTQSPKAPLSVTGG